MSPPRSGVERRMQERHAELTVRVVGEMHEVVVVVVVPLPLPLPRKGDRGLGVQRVVGLASKYVDSFPPVDERVTVP